MTKREVSGNVRTKYARARKLADEIGLTPQGLDEIAEGVREFDASRSSDARSALALEKIAGALTSSHKGGDGVSSSHVWEEARLRRREVYAQELQAVAFFSEDGDDHFEAIKKSDAFKRLVARLAGPDAAA